MIRNQALRVGRYYVRAGDACKVSGHRGVFRFVAHVINAETGSEWAEVVGPMTNPRTRSFRIDRIKRSPRSPLREVKA